MCAACGDAGPALCERCSGRLVAPPGGRVPGVGRVPALFSYEGVGARVVRSMKYHDARLLVAELAPALADLIADQIRSEEVAPFVTWVPTSGRRRRARGFDQSELLARAAARHLGLRPVGSLRRRGSSPQTGRDRRSRAVNAAFEARGRFREVGLVLVDDVCTTGATLRAARSALTASGHRVVGQVVMARTP